MFEGKVMGVIMDPISSIDINTELGFEFAEFILQCKKTLLE